MTQSLKIIWLFLGLVFLAQAAYAETSTQKRRIEEEKRAALIDSQKTDIDGNQRILFDWGGWINFRYIDYDNDDNDSSSRDSFDYTYSNDTRLWMKAYLMPPPDSDYKNRHSFYLRLKDLYITERPEDTAGGYDHDGPHLDYAYAILDLRPFWLEIGRHYLSLGRGIAYSDVGDGIQMTFLHKNWKLKALVSRSLPHQDNIDTSIPGYSKESARSFYGIEAAHRLTLKQTLYGFWLLQRDFSDSNPIDTAHTYTYNSQYFGLGAQGKLPLNIDYWVELIHESGKSYIFDSNEKKNVSAWGLNLGISYDWQITGKPEFSLEYAFGSGDSDRTNVTDTQFGNTLGQDKNFLYFGYIPTGYALSPRLSNIHLYRIGATCVPFEKSPFFKKLKFGINYYRYYKDKSEGGIYDPDANVSSSDIGSEIDLELSWQISSELRWILQYGHFFPGGAYSSSNNDSDKYLSLSLTLTF